MNSSEKHFQSVGCCRRLSHNNNHIPTRPAECVSRGTGRGLPLPPPVIPGAIAVADLSKSQCQYQEFNGISNLKIFTNTFRNIEKGEMHTAITILNYL